MRWPVVLLICILGAGAAVAGFFYLQKARDQRDSATVQAIATQLGATPQSQLAAFEKCWDIGSHCGLMIYFTTSRSREALGDQVAQLGLSQVLTHDVDGRTLFADLNMSTTHVLTVDGQRGTSQPLPSALTPAGYEWLLATREKQNLFIALYTTDPARTYTFDGQPHSGNVIGVMLQTR